MIEQFVRQGGVTDSVGSGERALRVVVADDHATFADLLSMAIDAEPGLECVGTAGGAKECRRVVEELAPDVVVMDVELGDGDGIETTAELVEEWPRLRVVVLTAKVDTVVMHRAAAAGACALLPKSGPLLATLRSIKQSRAGGFEIDAGLLRDLVTSPDGTRMSVDLTARETEVLALLADGLDVRRIATQLVISQHTCRGHVKSLLRKLDAHSQLEAVAKAARLGLVTSRG